MKNKGIVIIITMVVIWSLVTLAKENIVGVPSLPSQNSVSLEIYSGSENQSLEPIVKEYAQKNNFNVNTHYEGSVDIMMKINNGDRDIDAAWVASSLWLNMSDSKRYSNSQSIMRSPVVFALKKSKAAELGWVNKRVSTNDILKAIRARSLSFAMTSATQSNSGASAYFAFLYAFAGNPDILESADVSDENTLAITRELLKGVDRSSGSSGWLKDLMYKKYDQLDAMVNYEALVIELNQKLIAEGKEPLYVIYPEEGIMIADSPLAYIDNGDTKKKEAFLGLQKYLLSQEVQDKILQLGRRTSLGLSVSAKQAGVFNQDWGIKADINTPVLKVPRKEVIEEALGQYQLSLRKPSYTIYAVDVSGSMQGQGLEDLKTGLTSIIDQQKAKSYFLQATKQDVTIILPFNDRVLQSVKVVGNDPTQIQNAINKIRSLEAGGGTDIYSPVIEGMRLISEEKNIAAYFPAIILMTDGRSNVERLTAVPEGGDIPVYSIEFGQADDSQLKGLATKTSGVVFDGRKNLIAAFRKAKGYN